MPTCNHCHGPRAPYRRRGLCIQCYEVPAIREQYQPAQRFGRRGVGLSGTHGYTLPAPTTELPGEGKVAELERRAMLGLALWNPMDHRREL